MSGRTIGSPPARDPVRPYATPNVGAIDVERLIEQLMGPTNAKRADTPGQEAWDTAIHWACTIIRHEAAMARRDANVE